MTLYRGQATRSFQMEQVIVVEPHAATPQRGEAPIACRLASVLLDRCGYAALALALIKSDSANGCRDVLAFVRSNDETLPLFKISAARLKVRTNSAHKCVVSVHPKLHHTTEQQNRPTYFPLRLFTILRSTAAPKTATRLVPTFGESVQ